MPGSRSPASEQNDIDSQKSSPFRIPGALLLLALVVLFAAYVLGYLPQLGIPFSSLFNEAVLSSQHTGITELSPAVYGVAGLAAFLVLLAILRFVDIFLNRPHRDTIKTRPTKSIEQHVEEAAAAGISNRVARESYHVLFNVYPNHMGIDLADNLRRDLSLTTEAILALRSGLLDRSDRAEIPGSTVSRIVTVHDLLAHVEASPSRIMDRSGIRSRAADQPSDPNSTEARYPARYSTVSPEESRFRTRAHIANLRRRAADSSGPRRRAVDSLVDPDYLGPYRRATDSALIETASPAAASVPETSQEQHPADTTPKTADELNDLDPLFIPPLNKRRHTTDRS